MRLDVVNDVSYGQLALGVAHDAKRIAPQVDVSTLAPTVIVQVVMLAVPVLGRVGALALAASMGRAVSLSGQRPASWSCTWLWWFGWHGVVSFLT